MRSSQKTGIIGIALCLGLLWCSPESICLASSAQVLVGYGQEEAAGVFEETLPETAEPEQGTTPAYDDEEAWCLILVNRTHPLPDNYEVPSLVELAFGEKVDSRIYPALQEMFDDARAEGCLPHITSSFRTWDDQQAMMDEQVNGYLAAGYAQAEAERMAEEWVAVPGTSEHQLGLAVDISTDNTQQDPGVVWYWLLQNSYKYGFIQRYPEDKVEITGIQNEPWHFRYVGKKAAKEMYESGQCLEEYLNMVD